VRVRVHVALLAGLLAIPTLQGAGLKFLTPNKQQLAALRQAKTFCIQKAANDSERRYLDFSERVFLCTPLRRAAEATACDVLVTIAVKEAFIAARYKEDLGGTSPPWDTTRYLATAGEVSGSLSMTMKGAKALELKFRGRKEPDLRVTGGVDRELISAILFDNSHFAGLLAVLAGDIWGPDVLVRAWFRLERMGPLVKEAAAAHGQSIHNRIVELLATEREKLTQQFEVTYAIENALRSMRSPCKEKIQIEALRRGLAAGRTEFWALEDLLNAQALVNGKLVKLNRSAQEWLEWGDKQDFSGCWDAGLP
jgi:hypothetical protein